MFPDLKRFCFNLLDTLRCGHSHWLDLLIQLVFFDDTTPPPTPYTHTITHIVFSLLLYSPQNLTVLYRTSIPTLVTCSGNQTQIPGIVYTVLDPIRQKSSVCKFNALQTDQRSLIMTFGSFNKCGNSFENSGTGPMSH